MDNINDNKINIEFEETVSLDKNEKDIINNNLLNINNDNNDSNLSDINNSKNTIEEKSINDREISSDKSKKITNMNMPSVYTGEKGGMKGIDHQKIEKIMKQQKIPEFLKEMKKI